MIAFVQENFQGGTMREKQNAKMRFEFPQQEGQSLAQMFGFIEVRSAKRHFPRGVSPYFPPLIHAGHTKYLGKRVFERRTEE